MYAITIQTHHYAGTHGVDDRELLLPLSRGLSGEPIPDFATRAEARAYIAVRLAGGQRLGHGEYATPTYRVVDMESARYERLARRTWPEKVLYAAPGSLFRRR